MILLKGKVKLVKTGKIFGNFKSCFREYINNTNYYQMRQPGII